MTRRVLSLASATVLVALIATSGAHARAPKSFYGVAPQTSLAPADYERMKRAKVGSLRYLIHWASIDPSPTPGDENWGLIDPIFQGAAAQGVRVLPFVYGSPAWVAAAEGHDKCAPECSAYAPRKDPGIAAWRSFMLELVKRYGAGGAFWAEHPELRPLPPIVWQIWNEQNSPTFWAPKPSVGGYVKVLRVANEAVAAHDPKADIILGGMFGTPLHGTRPAITAWKFLDLLYDRRGVKRLFDGYALHPYASKLKKVKAQVDLSRDEVAQARDRGASLWVTEIGWASGGAPNPLNRGPQGQAARLRQAFGFFLAKRRAWEIDNVTWYSWRDGNNPGTCEWCPESGLLPESGFNEKPSFRAFTKFTGGS